jgi:hypothetical protein
MAMARFSVHANDGWVYYLTMNENAKLAGYSADVQMDLSVNGFVLSIGQLGPGFLILDDPTDYPPSDATITMSIDGEESRWIVHLPDGILASNPHTRIIRRGR